MIDFIDKTSTQDGTFINRKNMMGLQGFVDSTTRVLSDGTIIQQNKNGETLTISMDSNGIITEEFVGKKTIKKTIIVNPDNSITTEVIE